MSVVLGRFFEICCVCGFLQTGLFWCNSSVSAEAPEILVIYLLNGFLSRKVLTTDYRKL